MRSKVDISGNYEERGVIGTRIEIGDGRLTVLWMGNPVLETKFSAKAEKDGSVTLKLEKTGLRYSGAGSDYARITSVVYRDGKLETVRYFPITGEDAETLERTENNRYGNYDFADGEVAPLLQGRWKSDSSFELTFDGDSVVCGDESVKYRVLRSRGGSPGLLITDADPGKRGLFYLENVTFAGDSIHAVIPVCDGPQINIVFRRARK